MNSSVLAVALVIIGGLACLILLIFLFSMVPWNTWLKAVMQGLEVGALDLIGMNLRGVDSDQVVEALTKATKSGLAVSVSDMERHVLCNGNLERVVDAMIMADKAQIPLTFDHACAIDLAGRDVAEAVRICIQPIVQSFKATGVCKDGIQIQAKIKLTLKADIKRLIGGATEATIQARVIEGTIATIGRADDRFAILKNPSKITEGLLKMALDAGTAFNIVSIDIEDLDVGKNIGAHLQHSQALADKQVAQARAEGKRAMAIAADFEARADSRKMESLLIENNSLVPSALVSAYSQGRLIVQRKKQQTQRVDWN